MENQGIIFLGLPISDWISILNILVTSIIGIWIAIAVQNNLTKSRYLKEYFINEVKEIRDLYKQFVNQIYKSKVSAKDIKEWFKIMSERTQNFDKFIREKYKIENSLILTKHAEIQKVITSMDDFNEQFKDDTVEFSNSSKNDILRLHSELSCVLTQRVIDINSTKSRWRKYIKKG